MRLGSRLTIVLAAFALLSAGPANAAPKIPSSLLVRLSQNPMAAVPVIVLGEPGSSAGSVADAIIQELRASRSS